MMLDQIPTDEVALAAAYICIGVTLLVVVVLWLEQRWIRWSWARRVARLDRDIDKWRTEMTP